MTGVRLLPQASFRHMPWKNGGGVTSEIAVSPQDASLDAFHWRISLADVRADGPFSRFVGCERTLAVLSGHRLDLDFGCGQVTSLTPASEPFAFDADVHVTGRLGDGPIRDLNVMSRRGSFRHLVRRMILQGTRRMVSSGQTLFLLAHDAPVQFVIHDQACRDCEYDVMAGDAATLDQTGDLDIALSGNNATVFAVVIAANGTNCAMT